MADRLGTRVNLTLSRDLIRQLDRIRDVSGSGRATTIKEMLEQSVPTFTALADALELAEKKKGDPFAKLLGVLKQASSEVDQMSLEIGKARRRARRLKVIK